MLFRQTYNIFDKSAGKQKTAYLGGFSNIFSNYILFTVDSLFTLISTRRLGCRHFFKSGARESHCTTGSRSPLPSATINAAGKPKSVRY